MLNGKLSYGLLFILSAFALGQNVVVNPTANQNILQPSGTQLTANNLSNIRYVTPSDNWSLSGQALTGGTLNTVTFTSCPRGLDTSGTGVYFIYIVQSSVNEITQVTGGSCTFGSAGTIQFTPSNSYTSATVGTASSGIQEAINDACGTNAGYARVIIPPTGATNAWAVHGTIFAHCSRSIIDGYGALLNCFTRDRCFYLGSPSGTLSSDVTVSGITFSSSINQDGCNISNTQLSSNQVTLTVSGCVTIRTGDTIITDFTDNATYWGAHGPVTVSGSSITYNKTYPNVSTAATPGVTAIQNAAIEDNAFPGLMDHIVASNIEGGIFNEFIVVDNDQAATIRNLNLNGSNLLQCTANHCGSAVYSAGSTAATPVLWIDKSNISPQCSGNGVTDYASNTVKITDSVIQGFGMWGENIATITGSYGGATSDNVYEEEGTGPCGNPYNPTASSANFGATGIMFGSNMPLIVRGGKQPNGNLPQFASGGSANYNYYIVVHDSEGSGGVSFPLIVGSAAPGSSSYTISWPHVPPSAPGMTVQYDILRMQQTAGANAEAFPVSGSCGGGPAPACGSVATLVPQCSGLVCTYSDNIGNSTSSYTINAPNYFPMLPFWPGGVVLYPGGSTTNVALVPEMHIDTDQDTQSNESWLSTTGNLRPNIYVEQCSNGGSSPQTSAGSWAVCLNGDAHGSSFAPIGGILLQSGSSNQAGGNNSVANTKGRLNFIYPAYTGGYLYAQHLITLVDSNAAKTLATPMYRPPNDPNDVYIGLDYWSGPGSTGNGCIATGTSCSLAFGAPNAISNYIGNPGDDVHYLERLTSSLKTFTVPVQSTVTGAAPFIVASHTRVENLSTGGNPIAGSCGTGTTCSNTQLFTSYVAKGSVTLTSGSATISGLPFTSTSFICVTSDNTTAANGSHMIEAGTTSATVTGTGADIIAYICVGN